MKNSFGLNVAVLFRAVFAAMLRLREVVAAAAVFLVVSAMAAASGKPPHTVAVPEEAGYWLSWRMAAEANNMAGGWRTVPMEWLVYIERYMLGGQYDRDMEFVVDQVLRYLEEIVLSGDGMDGWILDVDDTCISNLFYYVGKRFG